jgi:hypothetical protein
MFQDGVPPPLRRVPPTQAGAGGAGMASLLSLGQPERQRDTRETQRVLVLVPLRRTVWVKDDWAPAEKNVDVRGMLDSFPVLCVFGGALPGSPIAADRTAARAFTTERPVSDRPQTPCKRSLYRC